MHWKCIAGPYRCPCVPDLGVLAIPRFLVRKLECTECPTDEIGKAVF